MERKSTYPEFLGRVHYNILRPIAGVRDDNREANDLAVLVFIRNCCECVPFEEGPRRKLETITGFYGAVFEMEPDNVIGNDFRVDIAATKL